MIKLKEMIILNKFALLHELSQTYLVQQRLLPILLNRIRSRANSKIH